MKTTRAIFTDTPVTIHTPRLLLQSIQATDLENYHEMRTDPQAMLHSVSGLVDSDRNATLEYIQRFLPPHHLQSLSLSIFELITTNTAQDAQNITNEADADSVAKMCKRFVGTVSIRGTGIPEIGYRILRKDWGKGYATEALHAILDYYWTLKRKVVEVEDDCREVKSQQTLDSDGSVREGLTATLAKSNTGSRRVLEKAGFRPVEGKEFNPEPDHRGPVTLIWYYLERPMP